MNDIITSFETLRLDAKTRMATSQGQQLVLAYMNSLLRLRDERVMVLEERRDEIAIALAWRTKPVFGFLTPETVCAVKGIKRVDVTLRGSVNSSFSLAGG
jgi:hypothetical protein